MKDYSEATAHITSGAATHPEHNAPLPAKETFPASTSISHLCDYFFGNTQGLEDALTDLDELIRKYGDDPEVPALSKEQKLL